MYRNSFQKGFLTVLYAGGSNPLRIWDCLVMNGHVKRVTDEDVRTLVLEIRGTNVATCYIFTPIQPKQVLGITLPFFVMVIKNLKKYFSFEIQILDDRDMRRRFRVSNFQTSTKVRPFGTTMPIGLNPGWNQIQFNLADFTKRAYDSTYVETQRLQIHANCRIRRIYFCDKLYPDDQLPTEYRLLYPRVEEKKKKKEGEMKNVRDEVPPPSEVDYEYEQEEMEEGGEDEFQTEGQMEIGELPPPAEDDQIQEGPLEEAIEEAVASIDEGGEKETEPVAVPLEENADVESSAKQETVEPEVVRTELVDAADSGVPPAIEEVPSAEEASAD